MTVSHGSFTYPTSLLQLLPRHSLDSGGPLLSFSRHLAYNSLGGACYLGISNVHEVVLVSELKIVNVERSAQSFQSLRVAMHLLQCQLLIGSLGKSFLYKVIHKGVAPTSHHTDKKDQFSQRHWHPDSCQGERYHTESCSRIPTGSAPLILKCFLFSEAVFLVIPLLYLSSWLQPDILLLAKNFIF